MDQFYYRLNELKSINEMRFKNEVLIPYFRQLGYQFVRDFHGTTELGKDIVMCKIDASGKRINYGVVIKAKKMNGRAAGDISEISTQVNQAFGSDYLDITSKARIKVDKVIIANNYPISDRTYQALHSAINHYIDRVEFLDGDEIVRNILKNKMKIGLFPVIDNCFDDIIEKYKLNGISFIKNKNRKTVVVEPSSETPAELLKGNFTLNSLGNEKMEALYKTGKKVTIYSDEIKNVVVPKIWNELDYTSSDSGKYEIAIGPIGSTNKKISLKYNNKNFSENVFLYVKNSGSETITLENEDPILLIKLEINTKEKNKSKFNITFREYDKISAYKLHKYEKLIYDLCNAESLSIVDEDTGQIFTKFEHNETTNHLIYEERILLLEKLLYIQEYFKQIIFIPNRSLTDNEVDNINLLHRILIDGYYLLPGGTINLSLETNENSEKYIKTGNFDSVFSMETTEDFEIFDTILHLGKVNFFIHGGHMTCTKRNKLDKELIDVVIKFENDTKSQVVYSDITNI